MSQSTIRAADHCPMKLTLDDALWRAQHFAICTAGCEDYVAQMRAANPNVKLYGYVSLKTPWDNWARSIFGSVLGSTFDNPPIGAANYVEHYGFDGLFLDCPFEYRNLGAYDWLQTMALIVGIENAIAPKHCMVNFGDAWTWRSTMDQNPLACSLAGVMREQFVQVAVQPNSDSAVNLTVWKNVLRAAVARCNGGKRVTLGIYDPNGLYPEIACLAHSAYHSNLSWAYSTAVPPAVGEPTSQLPKLWENL